MDTEIILGLGIIVFFGYLYYLINNKHDDQRTVRSPVDDEIDTILNSDKYKVKGRFEE
jgi:hypothetical protein